MQTSLRYGGESRYNRSLRLHAKERFSIDSTNLLQAHAELDTSTGVPSYLALVIRNFYPQSLVSLGVGVQYDKKKNLGYNLRAKKEFLINSSGLLRFNVKGRWNIDKDFNKQNAKAAAELCCYKFDFQKDQDLRLKIGYEFCEKVPYFQICENNWTFNFLSNGNWNVRFNL